MHARLGLRFSSSHYCTAGKLGPGSAYAAQPGPTPVLSEQGRHDLLAYLSNANAGTLAIMRPIQSLADRGMLAADAPGKPTVG